ncbi:MAG: AraC family transcriptional regulator [Rhizobium sp.]|nr:AraC family transcriptional regulator [Rhizobium sp.]
MPTSAGHEVRTSPDYEWDGRDRGRTPFTILQHTTSGAGNLRYDNRSHRLEPGDTMALIVPHNHRYWLEPGGRWEFFWLSMNGEEALRIHRDVIAAAGPVLRLAPGTIERLAGSCLRLVDGEATSAGRASAIAYDAMMALHDDVFGALPAPEELRGAMRPVTAHIEANLGRALPVSELARVAGMSRAHFSRLFAASEGMPPAEYVLERRLESAARLLARGAAQPVKEIAILTGFADPNYFAKAFRRRYGLSPTEFRTTGMYSSIGRG